MIYDKVCKDCDKEFQSFGLDYETCIYCWYGSFYGKSLVRGYQYLNASSDRH